MEAPAAAARQWGANRDGRRRLRRREEGEVGGASAAGRARAPGSPGGPGEGPGPSSCVEPVVALAGASALWRSSSPPRVRIRGAAGETEREGFKRPRGFGRPLWAAWACVAPAVAARARGCPVLKGKRRPDPCGVRSALGAVPLALSGVGQPFPGLGPGPRSAAAAAPGRQGPVSVAVGGRLDRPTPSAPGSGAQGPGCCPVGPSWA